jgi:hypothetical protein
MLGFKSKPKAEKLTLPQQVVASLDKEFQSWEPRQQEAFAGIIARIAPIVAGESDAAEALPADRAFQAIKSALVRLLPALAWKRTETIEATKAAALTHAPYIRTFCTRMADRLSTTPDQPQPKASPNG